MLCIVYIFSNKIWKMLNKCKKKYLIKNYETPPLIRNKNAVVCTLKINNVINNSVWYQDDVRSLARHQTLIGKLNTRSPRSGIKSIARGDPENVIFVYCKKKSGSYWEYVSSESSFIEDNTVTRQKTCLLHDFSHNFHLLLSVNFGAISWWLKSSSHPFPFNELIKKIPPINLSWF